MTGNAQASEEELQPFTSLFQNAAVARDYVPGCISEEDINELAAHIFFIEPTYKYDISKAPIDNVFSAYRIAVEALIRTEKLKLLAEIGEPKLGDVEDVCTPWRYEPDVHLCPNCYETWDNEEED